jgi:hypothetical protein
MIFTVGTFGDITKENLEYERIIKDKTLDEVTYRRLRKLMMIK